MTSDQTCTTRHSITSLLQPFLNRRIQPIPIFYLSVSRFDEKGEKKVFTSHFVLETEMMRYRATMVRFKTDVI